METIILGSLSTWPNNVANMFVIISVRVYLFFSTVRLTEIIVAIFVQKCELCQKSRFSLAKTAVWNVELNSIQLVLKMAQNWIKKTWHELSKIELG